MIRSLSDVAFADIHEAFVDAFADYATGAGTVREEVLRHRAAKNGFNPNLSAGFFDDRRLVGFTLVGIDRFDGVRAAYDIATGIRSSHRGTGLAGRMVEFIAPRLAKEGVERFYLEVLRDNAPAIRAYERAGFAVTRRFDCFALDREAFTGTDRPDLDVELADRRALALGADWLAWAPSWENAVSSIARVVDETIVLTARLKERLVGVLAYNPELRWIQLLAVHPSARRQGVASKLLAALMKAQPSTDTFKFNNVQSDDRTTLDFLQASGFRFAVGQFEMMRPIE